MSMRASRDRRLNRVLTALAVGVGALVLPALTVVGGAAAAVAESTPYTTGMDGFGQRGNGAAGAGSVLTAVDGGVVDAVDLHGGREHVVALDSDGTVYVWGSSAQGQLGLGSTTNRQSPTKVPGMTGVVAVETGHNHSIVLKGDGTVWTWGLNTDGQLGDGSTTNRTSPVQVVGLTDAVAIAAGRDMSYAIRADGTVVGWGRNAEGGLGDGTTTRRLTPVRVGSLTNIVGIAGGRDHGLALRQDGTVWAWGANQYGQVGDGSTVNRTSPVQVATGMTQVIAGAHHSYALRADGAVLAWGRNYRSNLGDGTTTQRTRPVPVLGISDAVNIGSGRDFGQAVRADGTLVAWGHNAFGQLGDGTTTTRNRATVIPGLSGVTLAGGGGAEYGVVLVGAGPQPNQPPVARFGSSCSLLDCAFTSTASTDADGTIVARDWDFGDGGTASGATPSHSYEVPGTYTVTLTVTDDDGAVGTATQQVTVSDEPPPAPSIAFRAATGVDRSSAMPAVTVPGATQVGDRLLLIVTTNRAATATTPTGWTLLSTGTDGTDLRSFVFTRTAVAGTAGSSVTVRLDATSKTSLTVLAYGGAGAPTATFRGEPSSSTAAHLAPSAAVPVAGSTVVSSWADKTSTVHGWTLPAPVTGRATTTGSSSGMITSATGDTSGVAAGTWPGATATAGVASGKALAWTIVLPPA